jgi:hypothetical protein
LEAAHAKPVIVFRFKDRFQNLHEATLQAAVLFDTVQPEHHAHGWRIVENGVSVVSYGPDSRYA